MQPQNERIALATAATLLKQVRRVLRHANDGQGALIKQAVERVLPVVGPEVEAPEPDDGAFFGALEALHGAEFSDEARDGPKQLEAPSSSDAEALRAEIASMRAQLAELKRPAT